MKKIKYSLFAILIIVFSQCSPDANGSFGEKTDRKEQLQGTWKIQSVFQVDLDAEKKSFPDFATKVNITEAVTNMPFSDFQMTIDNQNITTSLGNSPMGFIIEEGTGTWSWISNQEIETVNRELGINASNGISSTINRVTVDLLISTYLGINAEVPTLSLNYQRTDDSGSAVMRYEYILVKQ